MQTDTVVGIVGAVVLVSVMVGVFAYEYNNAGDDGVLDGGDDQTQQFEQAFPRLDASGDIDGDGTPNAEDDDVDGDGTPNAEDDDTVVTTQVRGTVAQSSGSASQDTQTLTVGEGAALLEMTLEYERPAGLPGQIGQQPRLDFELTDPNGERYQFQETLGGAGDATVTVSLAVGGNLPAGEWTLTATSNSAVAPAMTYEGPATVDYDAS